MTKGTLGIIACPMLEDELIASLNEDPQDKRILIIRTPYNGSLMHKMDLKGMGYEEIDEMDFMNGWIEIDPNAFNIVIIMNNLALHAEPQKLKDYIQDQLVMLKGRVGAAGLYYGMCGNYGWDITKWSEENLPYRVEVFRDCKGRVCDDCIGVAVGGLDGYKELLRQFTGMLLLTPAIATNWFDFLSAGEMGQSLKIMPSSGDPQKDMKDLLIMCGYTSAVQIDTGLEDRAEFDKSAKDLVDYMGFKLYQAPPEMVDRGPRDRIYEACKRDLSA